MTYTDRRFRIMASVETQVEVPVSQIAWTLIVEACKLCGGVDDAGLDWYTDGKDTYIGNRGWKVSSRPEVAALVAAADVLRCGKIEAVPDIPREED